MDIGSLAQILAEMDWSLVARTRRIRPTRLKVLIGVVHDQTPDEIAEATGLTVPNVLKHIQRTRKEWKVHSKAAITRIMLLTAHQIAMEKMQATPPAAPPSPRRAENCG